MLDLRLTPAVVTARCSSQLPCARHALDVERVHCIVVFPVHMRQSLCESYTNAGLLVCLNLVLPRSTLA